MPTIHEFAAAIHNYENKTYGMEKEMRHAHALVYGQPGTPAEFDFADLIKLGIDPTEVAKPRIPYFDTETHPLVLAAAMQDAEPEVTRRLLERCEADSLISLDGDRNGSVGVPYAASSLRQYSHSDMIERNCNLVLPRPVGRRCKALPRGSYFPAITAWLETGALQVCVANSEQRNSSAGVTLRRIAEGLRQTGGDPGLLRTVADRHVERGLTRSTRLHNYVELCEVLPYCNADRAVTQLAPLKGKSYSVAGLALPDPPKEIMVAALNCFGKFEVATLMRFLKRAPTLEELRAVSRSSLPEVLWRMPWKLLDPVVQEHAAALRALLIRNTSEMQYVGKALQDHTERSIMVLEAAEALEASRAENWDDFATGLYRRYAAARHLRNELSSHETQLATILVLHHMKPRPHTAPILEYLQGRPELQRALRAYASPFKRPLDDEEGDAPDVRCVEPCQPNL